MGSWHRFDVEVDMFAPVRPLERGFSNFCEAAMLHLLEALRLGHLGPLGLEHRT